MPDTHAHRQAKVAKPWQAKDPSVVPLASQEALRRAMAIESVPAVQFDDLLWLMAQESEGKVDARNSKSTARGLYQLLKAQYELNPNGVRSFGDAVEESQGGIRYIIGRYKTASAAKTFWLKHKWY